MKEYLKMSDVFDCNLKMQSGDGKVVMQSNKIACSCVNYSISKAVVHAINSHDELVENMNHYKAESEQWEARATKEASLCDELVEMNKELIDKLRKASEIMKAAHNSMFEQCLSNPVFNAWGKELNLSAVNELQVGSRMADEAIEMAEGGAA